VEAYEKYGDRVAFLGVAGRDDPAAMEAFLVDYGVGGFPHAVDDSGDLWRWFDVTYQPAWVFLNDSGEVTSHRGPLFGSDLFARLDDLLAA